MGISAVWILLIITLKLEICFCALCSNTYFGENKPRDKDNEIESNTAKGYLMSESQYIIDCCGVVDGWTIYVKNVAGTRTVDLQIWRPTTGSTYELVGENTITVTATGEPTLTISDVSQRITVKPNDKFGWWTGGTDLITYKKGGGEEDDNWLLTTGDNDVGDTQDWSGATVQNDRSYAIRVNVLPNNTPTFPNLPDSQSIFNDHGTGVPLFTVSVDDVDTFDVSTLSVSMTTNSQFSFDTSTLILSTSTITSTSSVEVLQFKVSDQCDNTGTASYTVTIQNRPPEIHNLPDSESIREDATSETKLHTLNVTGSSTTTCSLAASVPSSYPFEVKLVSGTSDYGIYSSTSPGFNYTLQSAYTLTVECTDTIDTDTGTFTVNLIQNSPPVISNLQNSTSVSTSATVGTTVFTVIATDAEGDSLSFSLTCDQPDCPFQIYSSGKIKTTEILTNVTVPAYDVFIIVSDGRNSDGPKTLSIDITDINYPVVTTNLPSTRAVAENTPLSTSVMQVSIRDLDSAQSHSFIMTSTPSTGSIYFTIDSSTGLISTAGTILDYEVFGVPTSFTLSVTVSDTFVTDTKDLIVELVDQNEAPNFNPTGYGLTTNEGVAGDSVGTPVFVVSDQDISDSYTLYMDCGASSSYFYMLSSSGEVLLQTDYDLDTGTLPTSVTCNVTATDSGYLTATATLIITIVNINDNTPYFLPSTYAFYASPYSSVGTLVGTTTATDGDIGTFGDLTYSLDQAALGDEFFVIDASGGMSINKNLNYSTSYVLTSIATDGGGLTATASVTVVVTDTTTLATTTVTNSYKTFFDEPLNWAWFIPCMLLLIGTLCFTFWIVFTCHGKKGCTEVCKRLRRKNKKPRLHRPARRGSHGTPGSYFSDWRSGHGQAGSKGSDLDRSVRTFPKPKENIMTVSNRLDPDETPSYSASHLDPICLHRQSQSRQ